MTLQGGRGKKRRDFRFSWVLSNPPGFLSFFLARSGKEANYYVGLVRTSPKNKNPKRWRVFFSGETIFGVFFALPGKKANLNVDLVHLVFLGRQNRPRGNVSHSILF